MCQMLLEKLGRDLVTQTAAVERVNVISSALTAAGQLRWRNTGQSAVTACCSCCLHSAGCLPVLILCRQAASGTES